MITAPQQIQVASPGGHPVDSTALTKDGIVSDYLPKPAEDGTSNSPGAETQHESDDYRLAAEEPASDKPSPRSQVPQAAWVPSDQPLVPSDEWTSQSSTKTRQVLLVALLGTSGVGLAIVLFVAFLRWYGDDDNKSPVENSMASSAVATDSSPPSVDATDNTEGELVLANHADDANLNTPGEVGLPLSDSELSGENEEEVASSDVAEAAPTSALPTEIIDGADLNSPLPAELLGDAGSGSQDPALKNELPEAFQSIANVLDWNFQPTLPDNPVMPTAPPVTAEDLGLQIKSRLEAIPPLDYAAYSQQVLPGLLLGKEQDLWYTINLWTQITGVPTVVDIDSLAAADLERNPHREIGKSESSTIDEVAHWLAGKLGLEVDARENRFLQFSASRDSIVSKLPKQISVGDLIQGEEQVAWLLNTLVQLFPDTEGKWSVSEGTLSCVGDEIDVTTWFNVVRLLENWRAAAGLPTALDDYGPGRVLNKFVQQHNLTQLQYEFNEVSPQATPVAQRLSALCSQAGIECWIDWPNVGENGLGPGTTALAVTLRRRLENILGDYVSQFALVAAIEDEKTIWLTTPRAYRLQPKLYVLQNDGSTSEQVQQKLKHLTPISPKGDRRLDALATPDNRFMIIRCCRPKIEFPGVLNGS